MCLKHEACSALFKEIQDYLGSRGVGCNIEEDYKNLDHQIYQENIESVQFCIICIHLTKVRDWLLHCTQSWT